MENKSAVRWCSTMAPSNCSGRTVGQTIKAEAPANNCESSSSSNPHSALSSNVQDNISLLPSSLKRNPTCKAPPCWLPSVLPLLVLRRLGPKDLTLQWVAEHNLNRHMQGRCRQQLLAALAVPAASSACKHNSGHDTMQRMLVPLKKEVSAGLIEGGEMHKKKQEDSQKEDVDEIAEELEFKDEPIFQEEPSPASPALVGYLSSELDMREKDEASSSCSSLSSALSEDEYSPPTRRTAKYLNRDAKSSSNTAMRHSCPKCSFNSSFKANLLRHIATHDWERALPFKCDHCDYSTDRKFYMTRHLLVTHKNSEQKTFACDKCSFSSNWKHCYKRHLFSHKEDREKFVCDVCGYTTEWMCYLNTHMAIHKSNREKQKRFACSYCDYKAVTKRSISRHVACHESTREKPFACAHCNYKTDLKFHLRRHLLSKHVNKK